jgi:hypothetical protein
VKYYDPAGSGSQVDVCWSGAGYYPAGVHVARDVELVVRLTRYFAESGRLDPSVQWQHQP